MIADDNEVILQGDFTQAELIRKITDYQLEVAMLKLDIGYLREQLDLQRKMYDEARLSADQWYRMYKNKYKLPTSWDSYLSEAK